LIGATIRLLGTQAGAVTDMNGNFELNGVGVLEGMYDIEIKYLGYKTEVRRKVRVENGNLVILNLEMETDAQELSDVVVVAKKNRENENMALLEQQKAVIAV
jgi:tonB-dependent receptor